MEERLVEVMENKEGDEELVKDWKDHNEECWDIHSKVEAFSTDFRLMHWKVDQIASCLGIVLYHLRMEQHSMGCLSTVPVGGTFSLLQRCTGFNFFCIEEDKSNLKAQA